MTNTRPVPHKHGECCDPTIPVCTCGHVWEYRLEFASGTEGPYTSADVVHKYRALYGEPVGMSFRQVA